MHICVTQPQWVDNIAGTLGCVFIDNETHESGVTKCTTGEAWSAFSWHHSSVFHCQWTHNQVFLLLSHMLIWNAKVYSFMWWNMCLVSFESWELILQFVSSGLTKLDETIGYCWCPILMRWSLWLQQWSMHLCVTRPQWVDNYIHIKLYDIIIIHALNSTVVKITYLAFVGSLRLVYCLWSQSSPVASGTNCRIDALKCMAQHPPANLSHWELLKWAFLDKSSDSLGYYGVFVYILRPLV